MQTTLTEAYQSVCDHTFDAPFEKLETYDVTSVSVFENEIPSFVEQDMDRLYGSLYSSLSQFKVNGKTSNAHTYVVRKGSETTVVLVFRIENGIATVLNEVIAISEEQINQFSETIFARFRSVHVLSFKSVRTDMQHSKFPFQRINCLEDIIVTLPESVSQYLGNLGKNTRRNLKRYTSKLKSSYPDFRFSVQLKADIDPQCIRDIIQLNQARMSEKGKAPSDNNNNAEKIIALAQECGLVCVATIDGITCAGAISFRVGDNYFMKVLAHDSRHNDYSLGILCCYHTLCECIERGGKEFHLLWGRYDYKYALLGVQHDLYHVLVYRSRFRFFLNCRIAFSASVKGHLRKLNLRLQDAKKGNRLVHQAVVRPLKWIDGLRK